MESSSRVVVVGGGILGVSVLYHLAREGWTDAVLFEKDELTSGSTWHAAGHCPLSSGSLPITQIQKYSNDLYQELEALTGVPVSWHGCGGIRLATNDDEVDWFHYLHGLSRFVGYEAQLISPTEIVEHHPFLIPSGVRLGFLTVTDGHVAPADVTNAMASGARALGSEIHRNCRVEDIQHLSSGEWRVITEAGHIDCEHVVNAAGSYAKVVAGWTGHRVPIVNMLHHYVVTEALDELTDRMSELPIIRDPYASCYIRQESTSLLVGPYEQTGAKICWDGGAPDWGFQSELLPPELDRLTPWLARAAERVPLFASAGIKTVVSGALTHTPDANLLLGPASGPPGYWMANGAAIGICHAGGGGKYLAQWMVHGAADISMHSFDPRRFGEWTTDAYTAEAALEDYQTMFYCYRPSEQHIAGRPLRISPLHSRLKAAGAQFEQVMGWERARWLDDSGEQETYSFRRADWWPIVEAECLAVRQRLGLCDLSSFAKYEVVGPDAYNLLVRSIANRLPGDDGQIILGHILSENGRIESEMTVTRLSSDRFFVLSAASAQVHDLDIFAKIIHSGEQVLVDDITDDWGCLLLTGPNSRLVLSQVTDLDFSNSNFPWLTAQTATVAGIEGVRLLRVTYTGELGWELHVTADAMPTLFDRLVEVGDEHGLALFGTYAMNSLRMEKAYRAWGAELGNDVDMYEAGMERFVHFDHTFVGRDALADSRERTSRAELVYMTVNALDSDCRGGEPVLYNNNVVGVTTSGAFGFAVGQSLAFAYIDPKYVQPDNEFEIQLLGQNCNARIMSEPAYDPSNLRLRA